MSQSRASFSLEVLAAYNRMTRIYAESLDGPLVAPVLKLTNDQLTGLFTPSALNELIKKPLTQQHIECDQGDGRSAAAAL